MGGSPKMPEPRVRLNCGTEVLGTEAAFNVHAFQGLRYAAPPTRFSAPRDAGCDGGVIDARAPSPICAQPAVAGYSLPYSVMNAVILPHAVYVLPLLTAIFVLCALRSARTSNSQTNYLDIDRPASRFACSSRCALAWGLLSVLCMALTLALPGWAWSGMVGVEDCLFINVYTPAAPAASPRPVMLWVHGGGYVVGSGRLDDPSYGSSLQLPAAGVVHVTLNYRLGAFGFLYLDESHATANLGLLDQLAALRWVQLNIHSFGGDPRRVLLYGHSAGGVSVLALQRMPAAAGLFSAAAALSPLPRIGASPADAAAAWRTALLPTGCTDLACARGLEPRTLATLDLSNTASSAGQQLPAFGTIPDPSLPNGGGGTPWVKFVVMDNVTLTEQAAVDVPLLLSGCREQGDFGPPPEGAPAWPLSRSSFDKWAAAAQISPGKVWPLYAGAPLQRWEQMGTDLTLFCGLWSASGRMIRSRRSPLYLNIWSFAVPFKYNGLYEVQYAAEGIDIWLTWGRPSAPAQLAISKQAEAVGDRFRQFLVDFAYSGSLSDGWQQYPAVCEYGLELKCSRHNAHARACKVYNAGVGRKFDLDLG